MRARLIMVLVATLAAVAVATAVMIPVLLKMMVGYAVLCVAMLSVALALLSFTPHSVLYCATN